MTTYESDVVIVGGGPGGLTAALELARRGVTVTVLERALTAERSFRGESISPDGVAVLSKLGVLADIEAMGALVTRRLEISERTDRLMSTEFARFDYPQRYPMEVPQPTLLTALDKAATQHPGYRLIRGATVKSLVYTDDRVTGVTFTESGAEHTATAKLVIAADGRYSTVLELSDLLSTRVPLDRDVVWMRLPLPAEWDTETYRIRMIGAQHGLFIPTYPDMVRVGFNIPKGGLKTLRAEGIDSLHNTISALAPELSDLVREKVRRFTDTSTLDIFTSQTPTWSRPGLVLIGDAAHTLTPILGQGVNHALIDGVVIARLVADALATGSDHAVDSATTEFQRRREPDIRLARGLQLRQERLFTIGHPLGVAARGLLYRAVNLSPLLRGRVLEQAYFRLQRKGATTVDI